MYSARWCGVCKQARRYFRDHRVPFQEHDIETSDKGRRNFNRLGGRGVPLILVGDRRMRGFSAGRFEQLYRK
jgi:glutaredoxin